MNFKQKQLWAKQRRKWSARKRKRRSSSYDDSIKNVDHVVKNRKVGVVSTNGRKPVGAYSLLRRRTRT